MTLSRILVVDDEPLNLELISEYLAAEEMQLTLHTSGEAAWSALQEPGATFDLILLDRMMPGLDGLGLLRRLKADARFAHIPVIMQTAAVSDSEVREGIAAGAYYYLSKPYDARTLHAIVRAAIDDRLAPASPREMLATEVADCYTFRSLDEARQIAALLAQQCPQPEVTALGLMELFVNAIEHGNLGFSYDDKRRMRLDDSWEAAVQARLSDPGYAGHYVTVEVRRSEAMLEFTIRDCGHGFEWQRYLHIDPTRVYDPNGRGIAMARQLSFASLEYLGCGNVAVACVSLAG